MEKGCNKVEDGWEGFWFEGVKPERAEVESVEEVVARITGGC